MERPRRHAVVALLVLALSGCGDSAKTQATAGERAAGFSAAFARATGVELEPQPGGGTLTILSARTDDYYARFGVFSIYVFSDADAERSVLESRLELKDYGRGVVVSSPSGDERSARLATAVRAALANDPSLIPAPDRLCSAVGIDVTRGAEGTCRLPDKRVTVVDSGSALEAPGVTAKLTGVSVRDTLPARSSYLRPERARGRFLIVRFALTNTQDAPLTSLRTTLVIGEKTYSESPEAYSLADVDDQPFPLQPGERATVTTAFDVPEEVAGAAATSGALELPVASSVGTSTPTNRDAAVGRIRLDGAPKLRLLTG